MITDKIIKSEIIKPKTMGDILEKKIVAKPSERQDCLWAECYIDPISGIITIATFDETFKNGSFVYMSGKKGYDFVTHVKTISKDKFLEEIAEPYGENLKFAPRTSRIAEIFANIVQSEIMNITQFQKISVFFVSSDADTENKN